VASGLNFRLFLSSTFSDFTTEREALQKKVFPQLADYCQKHGATFQAVDLRWGITEEAQREHDTMRICLEEIRRCQQLSPRPNFAVLLGDRYGWEPVPARIPLDQWSRLLASTTRIEADTIQAGYEGPDLNAIPPVMHLRKCYGDSALSGQRLAELRDALRRAAELAELSSEERLPYFASATHQEIVLGALNAKDEEGNSLHPEDHVNVYVRSIDGLPNNASASEFIDWDPQQQAPVKGSNERLTVLKAQLRKRLPGKVREIKARWCGGSTDRSHIDAFCAQFLTDQLTIIKRELGNLIKLPDSVTRNTQHHTFAIERARNFAGRKTVLERISSYLKQPGERSPLIIHGSGGIGKSSLMARAYLNAIESLPDSTVKVARFIGAVPGSNSLMTLLIDLTADIAEAYGWRVPIIPKDMDAARQAFKDVLSPNTCDLFLGPDRERPLVLFLDALDQLEQSEEVALLEWLPQILHEHARVVVSIRSGPELLASQTRHPRSLLEVTAMTPNEGQQMLDAWLVDTREAHYNAGISPSRGRRLTNQQRKLVLSSFEMNGKPLWLKLAYEIARAWPSWFEPKELPETVEAMVEDLISRRLVECENHPRIFVTRAMAYLTAGRFGLAEEELAHALATDFDVKDEFELRNSKTLQNWELDHARPRLPHILWSRLYFDLEPYLATAQVDNTIVYRWFHREFSHSLYKQFLGSVQERLATHSHLANTFRTLDAASRPDELGDDRLYIYTSPDSSQSQKALRRIMEQPWQLARAIWKPEIEFSHSSTKSNPKLERLLRQRRYELKALLSDFGFCQAKAHRIDDLIRDWSESSLIGRESKQWQQFLRTRASILRQRPSKTGWPANRILLQLALEEDPEAAVAVSAKSWVNRCKPDWTVSKAPLARTERSSARLLLPGTESPRDVYLDNHGRVVLELADGSAHAYDAHDGRHFGVVDAAERRVGSRSEAPPTNTGPGSVWPLGEGRWFRWQLWTEGGGPDGTASIFDPQIGTWTSLPQVHHHEVWTAVPLSDGRYASLGLYGNLGVLVIGSQERPAELLHVDAGPIKSDNPASGILELGDHSLVIWPAYSDGSGLWLKPLDGRFTDTHGAHPAVSRRWYAVPLGEATSGIRKAIRIDDDRFLTLGDTGEVRLWFVEFLERAARSKDRQIILKSSTYPNRPHLNPKLSQANPGAHWDALASDRRLRRLYRTAEGRLFASDSRQGDSVLLEWKDAPISSFQNTVRHSSRLEQTPLEPAEMELDAKLSAPRDWDDWVARAKKDGALHLRPRLWIEATDNRLSPPDARDPNPQAWGRWLYHYLREDGQRATPHFTHSGLLSLIEQALEVLAQLTPEDANVAIWRTEVLRREAKQWRDGLTKSPLTVLIERKPQYDDLVLAWIAFCESESRDWALAQCAELARLRPNQWSLLIRWAQINEHINPDAARELRLQAVNLLGMTASVRLFPGTEGYDLWEIYLDGEWSVWACHRPSPDIFAIDGQRLILAGAPLDGIRYLTLGHD